LNNSKYYIVINPEVYISENIKSVFLYNTKTGEYLKSKDLEVVKIVKEINILENLYCCELEKDQIIKNKKIDKFIEELKIKRIGYLIPKKKNTKRPIVLRPVLGLKKRKDGKRFQFDNNYIMNYLLNLTIQINNRCNLDCNICNKAFKQFTCCFTYEEYTDLSITFIKKIVEEVKYSSLNGIKILGGDIFIHSQFNDICDLLKNINREIIFYTNYLNVSEIKCEMIKKIKRHLIILLVNPEFDGNGLNSVLKYLKKNSLNFSLQFITNSEESLENVNKFIDNSSVSNNSISPFLTEENNDFFRKNVFIDKKKIFLTKHKMNEIYSKKVKNQFIFGNIYINSNGEIYSNRFENSFGNIKNFSIREAVYNEINFGGMWTLTRDKVKPCKDCLYELLCPSISSYEMIMMEGNNLNITACSDFDKNSIKRTERSNEKFI